MRSQGDGFPDRTSSSLPLAESAVLNDAPVACQTRRPTRRETGAPISRRRQPPPTHCGAKHRNGRDLIIATRPANQPLPSLLSAAAAQAVQAIPEPTTTSPAAPIPRSQHRQICTYPPRAKGFLNRRFEWFSLVTFFLQKKKVTRAGARNAPSRARRRNTCSPPGQRPPRERFLCLRRPHFFQQRKKWEKERRQKLRFCTSSARYTRL